MPTRSSLVALSLTLVLAAEPLERAAHACGGAAVSRSGSVGVDAQRIFLSVRGARTEIVLQLVVPRSPGDYGALIPLPGQPTIDAEPVTAAELDALDRATQVRILDPSSGGGGGCGCGADAAGPGDRGGVLVETVAIGPVTAASLRGDDGAAVNGWLAENGFVIPAEQRALVDAYSGAGRFFVAVKRNGASADVADSLGIHLTLDGDQRGLPLRFTRIGAAGRIAFTVFIAAPQAAGPSSPYTTFGIDALDREDAFESYADAVADAVAARGARAFVAEYRGAVPPLGTRLSTLVGAEQTLTRYSTVLDSASLGSDADFYGAAPVSVRTTAAWVGVVRRLAAAPGMLVLGAAVALLRRRRRPALLVGAAALLLAATSVAAAGERRLTGISADFTRFRLGATTVCTLATADRTDGTLLFDPTPCIEVPRDGQRAFGFALPPMRRPTRLPDGRELVAGVEPVPYAPQGSGEVGCLARSGDRCPTRSELEAMRALMPAASDLVVVARGPGAREATLARMNGTARAVRALHASREGTRVVVVFSYERIMRDSAREPPIGLDVVGIDLGERLRALAESSVDPRRSTP